MLGLLFVLLFVDITGKPTDWTYFPNAIKVPKYGIIMGGTSNHFKSDPNNTLISEPLMSTCITHLYAKRHGYAYYLDRDLGSVNNRTYGTCSSQQMSPWNKIILLQKLLSDVESLIWIDLDVLINDGSFDLPISAFIPTFPIESQVDCLPHWETTPNPGQYGKYLADFPLSELPGSKGKPFLYLTEDLNPKYPINLNSAIMIIRQTKIAQQFLSEVWNVGNDKDYFKEFDSNWITKPMCSGYWGWPWEQGGIWKVLMNSSEKYLKKVCILPRHKKQYVLNNIHGDPQISSLYAAKRDEDNGIPREVIFGYHHSRIGGRYMIKRLMRLGYITPRLVQDTCHFFVPPIPSFLPETTKTKTKSSTINNRISPR